MRIALHTRVRADRIEEYERAHAAVPAELTDAIRAMAHDGKKIQAVEIKGYWVDVRDPETLSAINVHPPGEIGRQP